MRDGLWPTGFIVSNDDIVFGICCSGQVTPIHGIIGAVIPYIQRRQNCFFLFLTLSPFQIHAGISNTSVNLAKTLHKSPRYSREMEWTF